MLTHQAFPNDGIKVADMADSDCELFASLVVLISQGTPPPSSDEDFDFDEDEEDDHGDYDANYFDNGEGDDDSGGDEGE